MRITVIILLGSLILQNLIAQKDTYYWAKGQKHYLELENKKEFILLNEDFREDEILVELNSQGIISAIAIKEDQIQNNQFSINPTKCTFAIIEKTNNEDLEIDSNKNILYRAPYFKSVEGNVFGISHLFYVKLKTLEDFNLL